MNKHSYYLSAVFTAFLHCIFSSTAIAQDTLVYTDNETVIDIGRYVLVHMDDHDVLSLQQIKALPDSQFEKSKKNVLNFANTISSVGLKLYLKNQTAEPLFISFESNEAQHIEVLTLDEAGNEIVQKGGTLSPISNRYLKRGNTILELGSKRTLVCIKAKTKSSFYFPTSLGTMPALMNTTYRKDVFNGMVLGVLLAMCFYNLFIFFIVRDRIYLLYCLYVVMGL